MFSVGKAVKCKEHSQHTKQNNVEDMLSSLSCYGKEGLWLCKRQYLCYTLTNHVMINDVLMNNIHNMTIEAYYLPS